MTTIIITYEIFFLVYVVYRVSTYSYYKDIDPMILETFKDTRQVNITEAKDFEKAFRKQLQNLSWLQLLSYWLYPSKK